MALSVIRRVIVSSGRECSGTRVSFFDSEC